MSIVFSETVIYKYIKYTLLDCMFYNFIYLYITVSLNTMGMSHLKIVY